MSAPVERGQVLAQRATALLIDLTAVAATAGLAMLVFALVFGMHLGVAAIASAAAALGIFGIIAGALVVLAVSLALVIAGSIAFARRDLVWHTDRMRAGRPAGPVPRPETFALKAASGLRAADSRVGMSCDTARMSGRTTLGIAAAAAAGVAGYAKWIRPRQLTWGARPEEVDRSLPGDDLVVRPTFNATRGISIQAPQEQVWPWLVQAGLGRAGWYSYDLLDNLGRRSSRQIIPELQHLAPGDIVPVGPGGQGLPVHALDPPRTMILGRPGDSSWVWQLDPGPDGSTRLICRIRSRIRPTPTSVIFSVLFEVADFWMLRKMLLNLRARAEGHIDPEAPTGPGP